MYDSFRARVEDREGDRWSVVGGLVFLAMHAKAQGLRILWIKPCKSDVKPTEYAECESCDSLHPVDTAGGYTCNAA